MGSLITIQSLFYFIEFNYTNAFWFLGLYISQTMLNNK